MAENTEEKSENKEMDVEGQVKEALSLYEADKIFMAYNKIKSLRENLPSEEVGNIFKFPGVQRILRDGSEAEYILTQIQDESDVWVKMSESAGIKSFYKHESGSRLHAVKIDGIVESSFLNILAVFYEVDLYQKWVPNMTCCEILNEYSKYRFLCYYSWGLPWPMANRDIVCYGYGCDLLESNSIMVCVHSVDDKNELQDDLNASEDVYREPQSNHLRIFCKYCGFFITPIAKDKCRVVIVSCIDPLLNTMPKWFLNLVMKWAAPWVLKRVREMAATVPTTEYQQKLEEKSSVYSDIRVRLQKAGFT